MHAFPFGYHRQPFFPLCFSPKLCCLLLPLLVSQLAWPDGITEAKSIQTCKKTTTRDIGDIANDALFLYAFQACTYLIHSQAGVLCQAVQSEQLVVAAVCGASAGGGWPICRSPRYRH